jgi:iron complex outermembrane recepter protein
MNTDNATSRSTRRMNSGHRLVAGSTLALAIALTAAGPVQAQTAEDQASAETNDAQIGDIIVTARRTEETLQDIPASVSAITGDDVARMDSLADVQSLVSGITFQTVGPIPAVGIRGFGNRTIAGSPSNSAVGIFQDGVFVLPTLTTVINRTDTARLEVAKGPQSTLYGRSSFAGAFNIVTSDPTNEFSGYIDAGYGFSSVHGEKLWHAQGAVSVPLSNTLWVRVYGLAEKRDGFVYDSVTDNRSGGYDRQIGRVKILWEPSDVVTARLSAAIFRDNLPFPFVTAGSVRAPLGQNVLFFNPASAAARGALRFGTSVWDGTLVNTPRNKIKGEQVTLDLRFDTPFGELSSLSDYQHATLDPSFSLDNTRLSWAVGSSPYYEKRISQELRISKSDGALDYMFGVYMVDSKVEQGGGKIFDVTKPFATFGPGSAQYDLANFAALLQPAYTHTIAYAAFGQLGYDITDALNLTVGIRYGKDEIDGTAGQAFRSRLGFLIPTTPITYRRAEFDAFTGSANLSYKLAEDITVYASYAKGNSPGGLNGGAFALRNFGEQNVDAYELGLKSRLFDKRLQLNLALFENEYSDLQLAQNVIASGQLVSFVSNAGKARGRGFDADVTAVLSNNIRFGLQYTYVDSKITSYTPAPPPVLQIDLTGVPLVRSPKHSLNASATFSQDIGPGKFQLTAEEAYTSSYTNDYQGVPAGFAYPGIPGSLPPGVTTSQVLALYRTPGYATTNIDASYSWDGWEISASVRNLFNKQYIASVLAFDTVSVPLELPGRPRTIEFGVKYKF